MNALQFAGLRQARPVAKASRTPHQRHYVASGRRAERLIDDDSQICQNTDSSEAPTAGRAPEAKPGANADPDRAAGARAYVAIFARPGRPDPGEYIRGKRIAGVGAGGTVLRRHRDSAVDRAQRAKALVAGAMSRDRPQSMATLRSCAASTPRSRSRTSRQAVGLLVWVGAHEIGRSVHCSPCGMGRCAGWPQRGSFGYLSSKPEVRCSSGSSAFDQDRPGGRHTGCRNASARKP